MIQNQYQNFQQEQSTTYDRLRQRLESLPLQEAINSVEEYLRSSPDDPEAHNDLGVLYYKLENKLQTLGHYEKAVRLAPDNSSFRKNLASFYFVEMGWTDDAIGIYTDLLTKDPSDVETLSALGIISNAVGRPDESRIFLTRIIELEPWNNDARQALVDLTASGTAPAVNAAPELPLPIAAPQSTLEQLAEEQAELSVPTTVAGIDAILAGMAPRAPSSPLSVEERYQQALHFANDGNSEAALALLRDLLTLRPDNPLLHNDLAVLCSCNGEVEQAVIHQERAVALEPGNSTFRKNLAGLYYSGAHRADDAIALYTNLLRENPMDTDILGALALISIDNNRPDEARIFLNRVMELAPDNDGAQSLLEKLNQGVMAGFFTAAG